jgi:hypothetical protein
MQILSGSSGGFFAVAVINLDGPILLPTKAGSKLAKGSIKLNLSFVFL